MQVMMTASMRGVCDYASIRELHAEVQAQTRGRKTN